MGGGSITKRKLLPGLILFLGLFLLAFAALLSPTRGDEPEWRPLEDFNAVWIPRWSAELYEEECQGGVIDYGVHTLSQVYLAWDAQEGASAYDFKADRKEGCFPPMPQYILSGDAVPEDIPQPAMGIARLDRWEPGVDLATGLADSESFARDEIYLLQNEYDCYLKSIYNYQIAMEFEYLAGEPPVITATNKDIGITLDPAEINPTSGGTLVLKVQIKRAGTLLTNQDFTLRIYPVDDNPTHEETQKGGHAHAVDGGDGRPLVRFQPDKMNPETRSNTLFDEYYRIRYEAPKNTWASGTYTATFIPHSTAPRRGIIPYGGIIRFEVEYKGIKQTKDLVVRVPNLFKLSPSGSFPLYKLVGGNADHPGPPYSSTQNWNHYGTEKGTEFLDKMGIRFYYNCAEAKRRLCYNDMLLIYGGNFDAIGTRWKILPGDNEGHKEHTGHPNFGETNCDLNYNNLLDTDLEWISSYILARTKDKVTIAPGSGREIIHDEPDNQVWHIRLYENLMVEPEEGHK